jgi:hypothetical protein
MLAAVSPNPMGVVVLLCSGLYSAYDGTSICYDDVRILDMDG